jgi:S1-C subfamily serine protease
VGQTVTSGIVSALARSNTDINDFDFFIQTDAAINPGNSGGPLVDMNGDVVGVNSAIFSKTGGSLGIGFSIPTEMVRVVLAAEEKGQVSKRGILRPWLGFTAQSVTSEIAASLGFDRPRGALVSNIVENGPADQAGLKRGDVITAFNGRDIKDGEELKYRIATMPLGETATLLVKRQGQDRPVTFTAMPPSEIPARDAIALRGQHLFEGATVINVSPAVIEEMDLKNQENGVVISEVVAGSTADRIGLAAGDGVIALGKTRIVNTRGLEKALASYNAQRGWFITIRRGGRDQTLVLR